MTDEEKQEILNEIERLIIHPVFIQMIKKQCLENGLCSLKDWDIKKEYYLRVFAIEQLRIRFEREKDEMN
jgi:hypothetical protein